MSEAECEIRLERAENSGRQGRGLLVWSRGYSANGSQLGAQSWGISLAVVGRCQVTNPGTVKEQLSMHAIRFTRRSHDTQAMMVALGGQRWMGGGGQHSSRGGYIQHGQGY